MGVVYAPYTKNIVITIKQKLLIKLEDLNSFINKFYSGKQISYNNDNDIVPLTPLITTDAKNIYETVDLNDEITQDYTAYINYIYASNHNKAFILKNVLVKFFSLPFTGKLNTSKFEECVKSLSNEEKNQYFNLLIQSAVIIPNIETKINAIFIKRVLDEFIRLVYHLENVGLLNDNTKLLQVINIIKYLKDIDIQPNGIISDLKYILLENKHNQNILKEDLNRILTKLKYINPARSSRTGPDRHAGVDNIIQGIFNLVGQ
jgi:hypothetical protein